MKAGSGEGPHTTEEPRFFCTISSEMGQVSKDTCREVRATQQKRHSLS